MQNKTKVLIALVALLTAYAFGRFSAPERIKIETKLVEVEKKTNETVTDRDKHKETRVIEITRPDGTKERTTVIVEDDETKRKSKSTEDTARTEETSREETRGSKVTVAALAGVNLSGSSPVLYGAIVSKPILGPVTVGVWGLNNSTGGLALGLTF